VAYDITLNDGTVLHFEKPPTAEQVSKTVKALVDNGDVDPEKIVERPKLPPPPAPLSQRQLAQLPEGAAITPDKPGLYRSPVPIPAREGFRRATMTTPTGTTGPEKNETILGVPIPGSRVLLREAGGAFEAAGEPDVITTAERAVQRAEAKGALPTESALARDLQEFNPFGEQTETPEALYGPAGMQKKTRGEILAADQGGIIGDIGGWYASLINNPGGVLKTDPVEAGLELVGVAGPLRRLMKASQAKKAKQAAKGVPEPPPPQTAPAPSPVVEEVEDIVTSPAPSTTAVTQPVTQAAGDVVDDFQQVMTAKMSDIEKVREGVIPGGDPLPVPVSKSFQQAVDQAKNDGILDRVEVLIDDVNSVPRPLSDAEGAAVMLHGRRLQDQHMAVQERIREFAMADRLDEAKDQVVELARIEESFYNTMEALKRSASERGRALNAQKMMIGKDYDVISMKARATASRGKKLTAKEAKNIERVASNIKEYSKVEQEIIKKIAQRLGKPLDQLDVDANGFPLEATTEELKKLMDVRTSAIEMKQAADLADLRALDSKGYVTNLLLDVMSMPKMFLASVDLSAPGRQGIVSLSGSNSVANTKAVFRDMFGAVKGGKAEQALDKTLDAGEMYAYRAQREIVDGDIQGLAGDALKLERLKAAAARGAGVDYTGIGSRIDPQGMKPGGRLRTSEDQFSGNVFGDRLLRRMYKETDKGAMAEAMKKLDTFGRFSERTYSLPLNRLRKEKFMQLTGLSDAKTVSEAQEILKELGSKNLNEIADLINMSTGRTKLPLGADRAPKISRMLNAIMFSPKFAWSRVRTLMRPLVGGARLAANAKGNHLDSVMAERIVMRELGTVALKWASGVALLNAAFAEEGSDGVNLDPMSSDFGKIRIGNTRYDATGGLAPMLRLLYRPSQKLATGELRNYGEGLGREVERALRGKASPAASIGFQLAYGKDFKGDPIESLPGMALGAVMPISLQDMQEFTEKYGVAEGVARMAPSVFGIGASDYKDRK
tara:strand:- start:1129 stop:4146 length:3018 start_codon:yes stop_codon:yes gene_type:complete